MRDSLPVPDVPASIDPAQAMPHVASVGALFATMMGWLPFIVAVIPAIYYLILIYESKTVQGIVERRRARRAAKKLAKAQAAAIVVAAKGDANTVVAQTAVSVAKEELKSIPPTASS